MYEYAEEVESICSTQDENEPVLETTKKKSYSDFPHEVELRFQCTPDSASQRINRYIVSDNNRLDDTAYNCTKKETENIIEDVSIEEATTKTTSAMKNLDPSLPKIQKWTFFRHILCVDCC